MRAIMTILLLLVAATSPAVAQTGAVDPAAVTDVMGSDLSDEEKIAELNRRLMINQGKEARGLLYNNLGVIFAEREDWAPARDSFIAAIQSDPQKPSYHRNLGMVMANLGMPDMAVSEYRTYMELSNGTAVDGHRLIGDVWRRAGDGAAALAAYSDGIEAFGGDYNGETAQMVMAQVLVLEEMGDESQTKVILDRWAEPARLHLDTAGDAQDQLTKASRAIVGRLLKIVTDNAKLLAESGYHAEAAAAYERAMGIDPSREDLLPMIASEWLAAGETMKAKAMAQRTTREHPEKASGWRAMGRIADAENRHRDAIAAYTKALELEPDRNDLAARIGTLYLKIGDSGNARKYMEPVVSDPETPVEMIYNYAISLQRDKNFGLSVPPLRKVVEREPEMAQAWQALATGLRKSKQYGDAAAAYERCLALDPDPKHAFQKGFCHGRKGQFAKAVEAYNRALEMDPTYSKPYYNLGLAYMKLKNYEDALAIFEKAQAAEGESYRLFFNMGACHYGLENDDLAVEMYDLAIARKETSSAWNNLGLALDRMGEKSEAQSCYKKAKALKAEGR